MSLKLDKENLEQSLTSEAPKEEAKAEMSKEEGTAGSSMSIDEEIGVHKGSLNTLAAERMELAKMMQNVEAIMQAHLKRLEELGVKIESGEKK
jgi:hypothetical protein